MVRMLSHAMTEQQEAACSAGIGRWGLAALGRGWGPMEDSMRQGLGVPQLCTAQRQDPQLRPTSLGQSIEEPQWMGAAYLFGVMDRGAPAL